MPDYGEILAFLAANPPHLEAERELHASLLELLAHCLRSEQAVPQDAEMSEEDDVAEATEKHDELSREALEALAMRHARWGRLH